MQRMVNFIDVRHVHLAIYIVSSYIHCVRVFVRSQLFEDRKAFVTSFPRKGIEHSSQSLNRYSACAAPYGISFRLRRNMPLRNVQHDRRASGTSPIVHMAIFLYDVRTL